MTGFSIPSAAIPATLLQTAGGKREGQIYVMERVSQHAGPETPLDMLNRAEGFFAFRPKDNGAGVLLVAKARTVSLTVPATAPEDAARLSAEHHSRVLDYLNATATPFFAVAADDGVHLVNRAHVLYARPED